MNTFIGVAVIVLVLIGGFFLFYNYSPQEQSPMPEQTQESVVQVIPIEHAAGILRWAGTTIYFDPTGEADAFEGQFTADIVLVTDIHGDHLSTTTLTSVVGTSTSLIVPQAVKDMLPAALATKAKVLANDASITEKGFQITAIPMYNLPGAENANRHTKGRGNGYVIERDGYRVYVAGDTAGIPEMRALTGIGTAFVPMNLPYTMDVDEAASAVLDFKPQIVYPYHYRTPEGLSDVNRFKQLVNAGDPSINVVLGAWYPAE